MDLQLGDVQETALIPLVIRADKNCPIGTERAERDRQMAVFLVCWFKKCGKGRIF